MDEIKLYIPAVIDRASCNRHNASTGIPCFFTWSNLNERQGYRGVCSNRAKAAGFVGQIQPSSIRKTNSQRRNS